MLTRSISDNNLYFDSEINLLIYDLHREQRQRRENQPNLNNMAQPERKTLSDFAMPDIASNFGGIVAPTIANNNFEIKPSIIQMVQNNQFRGLQGEDPYAHILTFLNVCATFKITHNRILETQIAQQASSSNTKTLEKLPSQPEYVQKECC